LNIKQPEPKLTTKRNVGQMLGTDSSMRKQVDRLVKKRQQRVDFWRKKDAAAKAANRRTKRS
jgi:hypothetical protein